MPTVNLLPNADVSNSPPWTLSTGSDVYALLNDDNTGRPATDSRQITTTGTGRRCIVEFQDFGESYSSIDSVQGVIKMSVTARSTTYVIEMQILDGSSSVLWTENTTVQSSGASWITYTFTQRDTDGTDAWTDADIDALRMKITSSSLSGGTLRVTYAYFIIGYTVAVTADNATFFGANF
jgi:hypothetical protein